MMVSILTNRVGTINQEGTMPKIEFIAKNKFAYDTYLPPYPASSNIPEWWKKQTPYDVSEENPNGSKLIVENRTANATFKKCTPMLDALTSGYIIPLWSDVQVRQTPEGPRITWRTQQDVFQAHGESSHNVTPPVGYSNRVFKYINCWIPKTPKGYSCLVLPPIGHRNLPFQSIPAVLDSDKQSIDIVPPMWLKEGFEGIVEKGTPMFQLIPFKRDNWESKTSYFEDGEFDRMIEKTFNTTLVNHYMKNIWSKKTYK